jgi:hypothetical protein
MKSEIKASVLENHKFNYLCLKQIKNHPNQLIHMKKVFGFLVVAAMMSIVACGPSPAEQKALESKLKKEADSIADALTKQMSPPEAKADTAKADTTKKK